MYFLNTAFVSLLYFYKTNIGRGSQIVLMKTVTLSENSTYIV